MLDKQAAMHLFHHMRDEKNILQSLDLPDEAVPLFLEHIEKFCMAHGGERTYGELLTLVNKYKTMQGKP